MPVNQMQRALRRLDDDELSTSRFTAAMTDRHLTFIAERPARQNQVAVAAFAVRDVQLKQMRLDAELMSEQARLIVVVRAADMAIDFLQTDQIGFLFLDDFDDSFETVAAIGSDTFVDIIGQQTHLFGP